MAAKRNTPLLSRRRKEVLVLSGDDLPAKNIADKLHLKEKTVRNHICAAKKKVDKQTIPGALIEALRQGAIPLEEVGIDVEKLKQMKQHPKIG